MSTCRPMDIELLKTFLEVCKTRHFGRAADNLFLTQSAVSARIRQLEGLLNCEVFSRQRNNIQLTPAGERLLLHADNVLSSWERARQDIALHDRYSVSLTIASTAGLWDTLLQTGISAVHASHPELRLRAETFNSDLLVRKLLERTLDVALLYDPPKAQELVALPLTRLELILVSAQPADSVKEAQAQGYIMVDWGTAFQIFHDKQETGMTPPWLQTSHSRMALDLMLSQGGCCYLPRRLVQPLLQKGSLYQVSDAPVIPRDVYGVYHSSAAHQEEISLVMNLLLESARVTQHNGGPNQ
ncbi:LysR substrate-binding domain-containing protein [Pokkaliibacter sp. CJK22405]|uniref:LysR substrate-binding domain-containing protein n=1 Tax=Pokkaliibacter sp. CJK22405 TaxID=3384615 RepID=UPI003984CC86